MCIELYVILISKLVGCGTFKVNIGMVPYTEGPFVVPGLVVIVEGSRYWSPDFKMCQKLRYFYICFCPATATVYRSRLNLVWKLPNFTTISVRVCVGFPLPDAIISPIWCIDQQPAYLFTDVL